MPAHETTSGAQEERPRCLEKDPLGRPCWRGAVERRYSNDDEPTICAEHLRAYELILKRDELRNHLDALGEWIATWDDPSVGETRLQHHAFTMRERMVEEFWRASVEAEAAEDIADQGPDEEPLTLEQARRGAKLTLCSGALSDARCMFEDLQMVPEEAFGTGSRWHFAAALYAVGEDVNAQYDRFGREMGRR